MKTDHPPLRNDDDHWQAVMARDDRFNGVFVYAVESTGIFCKPSCPSRRPRRDRVRFFADAETAAGAGFRPCKRCRPDAESGTTRQERAVRIVCTAIAGSPERIPTLEELGELAGLSPYHLQRVFKQATGLSPRKYAEALRLGKFRTEIRNGETVTSALYGAGYGSPSRIYEKADAHLGMTPASYAKGGAGASIAFATAESPLGRLLVAATGKGICFVGLGDSDTEIEAELARDFPAAEIRRDDGALGQRLAAALEGLNGTAPRIELPLDVRATAFQWRVWQCLCAIPTGKTRTYGEIAAQLGQAKAARAVGRACATNPVSLIVPCHRAVGADGSVTGYRWGVARKHRLLESEKKQATS